MTLRELRASLAFPTTLWVMDVQLGPGAVDSLAGSFIPCKNYSTAEPNLFFLYVSRDES